MRGIIDTNVLVSGLFFKGIPFKVLNGFKQGKYIMTVSGEIVSEYQKTVNKLSRHFPHVIDAKAQLEMFVLSADICQTSHLTNPICADPDDDKFFACAVASRTKVIVNGDKHLLDLSGYQGIEVLTPRQFLGKHLR